MSGDHNAAQDREYHRKRGKEIMEQIHRANQPKRADILHMAQEAGVGTGFSVHIPKWDEPTWVFMKRFAALVAAAEREECAVLCDDLERKKWQMLKQGGRLSGFGAVDCAVAIRNRSRT